MIKDSDLKKIINEINREPNILEKDCFENIWSEHCSYKSSYLLLEKFKDNENNYDSVIIGPGDDAAIIKFNDELIISIAMESHNHPSYIDPYEGAATGVGGVVRDILSMGTLPLSVSMTLYLGDINKEKNKWLLKNIISGSKNYSKIIGVASINNDIYFDSSYDGNPLVNVIAIGIGKSENITTSVSKEKENRLIIYGGKTGIDGFGGASFASKTINKKSSYIYNNIPKGNPALEKKLIDATLEAINNKLIQSCRDLGAAGIAGATAELAAKGNFGALINLEKIPLKENNMTASEIMLSESQERMLAEVKKKDVGNFVKVMNKNGIEAYDIGCLTENDEYIIKYNNKIIANLPLRFLVNGVEKKLYNTQKKSINNKLRQDILLNDEDNFKNIFLNFLSSLNISSKKWIFNQFKNTFTQRVFNYENISMSIINITEKEGLLITCGCEPYISSLDPLYGSKISVLENVMILASLGSTPLCLVNNLNFGNPNDPEQYWYLEQSIIGISEICKKLKIPIVGGNVSLYNESKEFNNIILPTASLGLVGKINLYEYKPSSLFVSENEDIYILGITTMNMNNSEYYKYTLQAYNFGENVVSEIPNNFEKIIENVTEISKLHIITSCQPISRGGIGKTLASMIEKIGISINLSWLEDDSKSTVIKYLFSESPLRIIVSTPDSTELEKKIIDIPYVKIGKTTKNNNFHIIFKNNKEVTITYEELKNSLSTIDKIMDNKDI